MVWRNMKDGLSGVDKIKYWLLGWVGWVRGKYEMG